MCALGCKIPGVHNSAPSVYSNKYIPDWSRATETMLHSYRSVLDDALCSVYIPVTLFDVDLLPDRSSKELIDNYYNYNYNITILQLLQ